MILRTLLGLSLLGLPGANPSAIVPATLGFDADYALPADLTGLWVATRLNYSPLPRVERVPTTDGWEHWFKLMDAAITIRPDGRFIASFK
jgi:hypothetical protein